MSDKKMSEVFLIPLSKKDCDLLENDGDYIGQDMRVEHISAIALAVNSHDKLVAALEKIYDLAAVEADEGSVIAMKALEDFKGGG